MWVSHIDGNLLGDVSPYTAAGGNRYVPMNNGGLNFSGQFGVTNDGDPNASLGFQRRFWIGNESLFGAGFYYDANQSVESNVFQQTGINLELFSGPWTARTDVTLPVGPRTQEVDVFNQGGSSQPVFQGHNIAFGMISTRIDETAMKGIEIEIARQIGNWSGEAFIGYYNFQGRIGGSTDGIKGGVRGYVTHRLAGNVAIADDPLFGTNVYGGFTWFFGGRGGHAPATIEDKLTIPVERNSQVVVNTVQTDTGNFQAILTNQGQPITVNHIDSGGTGGNGTFENPFRTLTDADNDPNKNNRNIVYTHSGSTFNNESYASAPNQRFLGEGDNNNHFVQTDQLGVILLPQVNGNQFPRPMINGANGGLSANDNTQFSNIRFQNVNTGIRANNVGGNVNMNRLIFNGGNTGIDIIGGTGTFTLTDVNSNNQANASIRAENLAGIVNVNRTQITVGNTGIDIIGGTGQFTFSDVHLNNNNTGIRGMNLGGDVAFNRTLITGGNTGIDILGGSGTFTFSDVDYSDQSDAGIKIDGGSSTVLFDGLSSVNQGTGGSVTRVTGGHNGRLTFDAGSMIGATSGDGLQFDGADGQYDFRGQTQLNGGDAGIDILGGSAGTFTFTDTTITNPTGTGLNVDGGSSTITFDGLSRIDKNNTGSSVRVRGGHDGTITFNPGTGITSTAGTGLQFDNADGQYDFRGETQLNGGDAGIDILGGSAGTFTFTDTTITNPTGTGLNVDGGSAGVNFTGTSSITQNNAGSTVNVEGGHNGRIVFDTGTSITSTAGDGLQFDNADGIYDFRGQTQLNGGDAGIDILGGSAGTFTFTDTTTITNPTGVAVNVEDLEATGTINYNGSIEGNNEVFLSIDTTAPGSAINFNSNGANSLTSTGNPNGAIFIFDADGDITITTPVTVIDPEFSAFFATDGDGTWSFFDMTITGQSGLNGGIDIFGQMGTVNFTNLNITTDSAGTGDATTGFLMGGNNIVNVMGNNNINADGGGALVLINVAEINMIFNNVTSTNNLDTQIGFAGDDGIDLLNVDAGTLDITGTTTVRNADGVGISIEGTGATATFNSVVLDTIGLDAIISGVAFDNPGIVNVNGGTVSNVGLRGFRIGSGNFGSGVLGGFNLNNTTFTNIGGEVGQVSNSILGGSGNVALPFSCSDLGNNTGTILFNGGADSCPN